MTLLDERAPRRDACQTRRRGRRSRDRVLSDDDALIEAARSGERHAYAELVRRYAPIAHRAAAFIAGPDEAEDAVQEAFVRAFYALPRFRLGDPFRPWLLAIVTNAARNRMRSRGQQARVHNRLALVTGHAGALIAPSAESIAVSASVDQQLLAAVEKLPEKFRLVVTCRYLLELSVDETAQALGWPRGTVKSRLSRALDRLRDALDDGIGS